MHWIYSVNITKQDRRRFWSQVYFTNKVSCWYWHGATKGKNNPYGRFWLNKSPIATHQFVFFDRNKYLPEVVRHSCHNPRCVNPKHLVPGTHKNNSHNLKSFKRIEKCQPQNTLKLNQPSN